MAKGFVRVPVEIIGDRVRPRSLFFNSHCVLRQQNSGCRLVARWFGSSGAPGQDHLFEGYENRAVGFTIKESSTVERAIGGTIQIR